MLYLKILGDQSPLIITTVLKYSLPFQIYEIINYDHQFNTNGSQTFP